MLFTLANKKNLLPRRRARAAPSSVVHFATPRRLGVIAAFTRRRICAIGGSLLARRASPARSLHFFSERGLASTRSANRSFHSINSQFSHTRLRHRLNRPPPHHSHYTDTSNLCSRLLVAAVSTFGSDPVALQHQDVPIMLRLDSTTAASHPLTCARATPSAARQTRITNPHPRHCAVFMRARRIRSSP